MDEGLSLTGELFRQAPKDVFKPFCEFSGVPFYIEVGRKKPLAFGIDSV